MGVIDRFLAATGNIAPMDVKLILLASLLHAMVAVAGATGSPEEGCISRTALLTSTLQDEMNMNVTRHGKDVTVKVEHSEGSCELRINDPNLDNKWLRVKLSLKDNIELSVNGVPVAPRSECVRAMKINTIKTVSVGNAKHLLPDCSQGPAIYQISQVLEDVLILWYEDEARLVLAPQDDTQVGIQVGGQEFVVCSKGEHIAAQRNASACTGGVGTSGITLIIPRSNKFIKVITADGKEAETQIDNGDAEVPPTVKKALINGTVIMRQCMPECTSGQAIPGDCSRTGYLVAMVILLVQWHTWCSEVGNM